MKQNPKSDAIQQKTEYNEIINKELMQLFENKQHDDTLKSSEN